MKAISPMIATVLLIAFTVAVGGILAVWFSSYTKTQTSSVSKSSACSTILADVKGISYNSSNGDLTFLVSNPGDQNITVTSIVIRCGNKAGIAKSPDLYIVGNGQNITTINVADSTQMQAPFNMNDCSENNIGISITYKCSSGGTNSAKCPIGTCFS